MRECYEVLESYPRVGNARERQSQVPARHRVCEVSCVGWEVARCGLGTRGNGNPKYRLGFGSPNHNMFGIPQNWTSYQMSRRAYTLKASGHFCKCPDAACGVDVGTFLGMSRRPGCGKNVPTPQRIPNVPTSRVPKCTDVKGGRQMLPP